MEMRRAAKLALEKTEEELEGKFDEELDNWLREIRDEAFVEIKI